MIVRYKTTDHTGLVLTHIRKDVMTILAKVVERRMHKALYDSKGQIIETLVEGEYSNFEYA